VVAAWRELEEETTLTPMSLELMRQGKSYSFGDESVGREWTVYPFAFRLKTVTEGGTGESGLQIDWEHEDWKWFDPIDVEDSEQFGGVPRLDESLRRVWFEKVIGEGSGSILSQGLGQLKNDLQSGARQLAGAALEILKEVIKALGAHDPSELWWYKVRLTAWHLCKNGRESMGAAIMSALLEALRSVQETLRQQEEYPESIHSKKWRDAVVDDLERRIALRETSATDAMINVFRKFIDEAFSARLLSNTPLSILTLSQSSTIARSLRKIVLESRLALDLRVLESRPLFEGVSLAGYLAADILTADTTVNSPPPKNRPGVQITIFTDASAALASEGVDMVLIGADRIASSGAVSNKTGSLPAILSAKHVSPQTKVVVLGDSEKIAPPRDPKEHVVENQDPVQVMRAWDMDANSEQVRHAATSLTTALGPSGRRGLDGVLIEVRNVFFEWVPPELIDIYLTENGVWAVEDIARHSEMLEAEEKRLFGDL